MSTATKPNQNGAGQPVQSYRGIVKNVISGDCIVIKSLVSKDGKVVEKQLMLSNITAPRIAKKTNPQKGDGIDEPDQVALSLSLIHFCASQFNSTSFFSL